MGYNQILNHLYSLESSKIKLGLKNIKNLLWKIGNPEKELKCIHVAGTNGKGSVCAMIFHILREAGYNAGLYTSPHLKRFNERIRFNDDFISDREIVDYYLKMKDKITDQSFFEITTAMAFLYFKDKKADFVVLEAGLGGRLDATNVITPMVSVITTIGLEHTDLLGNSIEKIAYEKAGIIKRNVPVVTGANGKALEKIRSIAKERNAPLILAKKHKNIQFKYLNGRFQHFNADIALTIIDTLNRHHSLKISNKNIYGGLKNTKWPARLQFIGKNVLIDCAHNPDGIKALAEELKAIKRRNDFKNLVIVFGVLRDKDFEEMLRQLLKLRPFKIILTQPKSDRALKAGELAGTLKKTGKNKMLNFAEIKNPGAALDYAKKIAGRDDLVVVAGSIYLVGEAIKQEI